MLKTCLKLALRNLLLRKTVSVISTAGLSLGLAAFLVICLYVADELSYDRYNVNSPQIFRVAGVDSSGGDAGKYARTPAPLAWALREDFPAIVNTIRIARLEKVTVASEEKKFYEDRVFLADQSILSVFTFPLISGDPHTALSAPRSVLLTREAARKYFGNADPSGRILRVDDRYDLRVTGVLQDIPLHSHMHFDFLISMSTANEIEGADFLTNPLNTSVYTYILLDEASHVKSLKDGTPAFVRRFYHNIPYFAASSLIFQPLSSIHLYSDIAGELEPNGDVRYVYIFSLVGALILLMACTNYMNILTARYTDRTREIGVRKVLGAQRFAIVRQFVGESTVMAALAAAIALVLVELILPIINSSIDPGLAVTPGSTLLIGAVLLAAVVVTGVISAGYPAILLSSLRPSDVLRRSAPGRFSGLSIMRVLIVFQFLVSTGLIVSTSLIWQQLNYIRNTKVGFDREHLIVLPLRDGNARREYATLKNQLLKNPNVLTASASSVLPGDVEYYTSVSGDGSDYSRTMDFICADPDFVKTYRIEIAEGRDFSEAPAGERNEEYLLNEAAVRELGWEQPIGRRFAGMAQGPGQVIGVVKNFNYKSLHQEIKPLFIALTRENANYLSIRTGPGDVGSTLAFIREEWGKVLPQSPYEYFFFDSHLDSQYRSEEKLGAMLSWFSGLAIAIACLGLVGVALISTAKKRREIGIRRAFGASSYSIVGLVTREFVFPVLIATISAWPLAWLSMNNWLQAFAYRIDIGIGSFVLPSGLIIVSAVIVVAVQAVRAASANPVDSLRYE